VRLVPPAWIFTRMGSILQVIGFVQLFVLGWCATAEERRRVRSHPALRATFSPQAGRRATTRGSILHEVESRRTLLVLILVFE